MKNIFSAIWAESLKVIKSKIFWITFFFFIFLPFMMGLMFFVSKNPELSAKLGMIGDKSALFGESDWPAYFRLLNLSIAMLGLIGFGFVTSWVFGREYSDRTVKDLLVLPIPRSSIVLAKFIIITTWCLILSAVTLSVGLIMGGVFQLSGWTSEIAFHSSRIFLVTTLLTIFLNTPVAFFASHGRGYLSPMGFVIGTLIIAQFIGLMGLGPYFPWAIPALFLGVTGAENEHLSIFSYVILFFTSGVGFYLTLFWWNRVDQT
ncbi:MAG TPA: bacitracin ABC transporter permease [Clostridiales bacterium]|nr:bacitracin ABC transporter permease [Clostridiales bacterium]